MTEETMSRLSKRRRWLHVGMLNLADWLYWHAYGLDPQCEVCKGTSVLSDPIVCQGEPIWFTNAARDDFESQRGAHAR